MLTNSTVLGAKLYLKLFYLLIEKQRVALNKLLIKLTTGRDVPNYDELSKQQ
jgi:hypothetical protein